jgi:KRAB domain-containing zinc finger protein
MCEKCAKHIEQFDKYQSRILMIQEHFNNCIADNKLIKDENEIEISDDDNKNSSPSYICPLCNKTFKSRLAFKTHKKIHHSKSVEMVSQSFYMCEFCGMTLPTAGSIAKHKEECLAPNVFTCTVDGCGKTYEDKSKFKRHERWHSNNKEDKKEACEICGHKFPKGCKMQDHMRSHTKLREFGCPLCPSRLNMLKNLRAHIKKCHPQNYHEDIEHWKNDFMLCMHCNEKFKILRKFIEHVKENHPEYFGVSFS